MNENFNERLDEQLDSCIDMLERSTEPEEALGWAKTLVQLQDVKHKELDREVASHERERAHKGEKLGFWTDVVLKVAGLGVKTVMVMEGFNFEKTGNLVSPSFREWRQFVFKD